jgi:phosphatidylserine decarboxylase
MQEALESDPNAYASFNQFFTRALKPELRPFTTDNRSIICPVDGAISQIGKLNNGHMIQAKGFTYDVMNLLGGSVARAAPFQNGQFATLYLAPKDYHRVHMPFDGVLREMVYVPGKLFSVNTRTTEHVPHLFARNERVIAIFDTTIGPMAIVLVGAMLVASISTVWAGIVAPASQRKISKQHYQPNKIVLKRGAEMGHFQLGSTAIILFGQNTLNWDKDLQTGQTVRLGQTLGNLLGE